MSQFDQDQFFSHSFAEHQQVLEATQEAVKEEFDKLVQACVTSIQNGGKIVFFGNGGSASDAQHLATELSIRYSRDRASIAGLCLNTDTSALTACGNDFGFAHIFRRQVEALCKEGDVLIGISTSGNSANVLLALEYGRDHGMVTAAFSGRDGGRLNGLADPHIIVPSNTTARIQEMHILIGHMLCEALEEQLGLV